MWVLFVVQLGVLVQVSVVVIVVIRAFCCVQVFCSDVLLTWPMHDRSNFSIEHWRSILRNGIKNMSGTPLQINGAAYGKGVYISPTAQMSLGYSKVTGSGASRVMRQTSANGNSFLSGGKNVHVMALCELIKGDQFIKKNNNIWVVADDKTMVTRFLFVFVPGASDFAQVYSTASQCNTTNSGFEQEVRDCITKTWGSGE